MCRWHRWRWPIYLSSSSWKNFSNQNNGFMCSWSRESKKDLEKMFTRAGWSYHGLGWVGLQNCRKKGGWKIICLTQEETAEQETAAYENSIISARNHRTMDHLWCWHQIQDTPSSSGARAHVNWGVWIRLRPHIGTPFALNLKCGYVKTKEHACKNIT